MNLKNRLLRALAERNLIEWKRDYYTDVEKAFSDLIESDKAKLAAGEDIAPPWIQFNSTPPRDSGWRQGNSDYWMNLIWVPFWRKKRAGQKEEYFKKFPPPDEEWHDYLMANWWNDSDD